MNPEGFEPPAFGSGIRRAAIAPWVQDSTASGLNNVNIFSYSNT